MNSFEERRKSKRASCHIPASLVAPNGQRYGAMVLDLSSGGARIVSSVPMGEVGGEFQLTLKVGEILVKLKAKIHHQDPVINEEHVVTGQTQLRWMAKDGSGQMGMEFTNISDLDRRVIDQLIDQLLQEES